MRKEKVQGGKVGTTANEKGYQNINGNSDDKNLKITFAVIEKMHYSDFNSGNGQEDFKPSDIIDEDYSDDEILKKFKQD
jgi:hypothetical protein